MVSWPPFPGGVRPRTARAPCARLRGPPAALLWAVALLVAVLVLGGCRAEDEFSSEGTESNPIALTFPVNARDSTVGPGAPSFYQVTGLNEDTTHSVSLTDLLDDADLFVFDQPDFTVSFCASGESGTTSEFCSAQTAVGQTEIFIQVKPGITETGTSFLLSVQ